MSCQEEASKITYYRSNDFSKILTEGEYLEMKENMISQFKGISDSIKINETFTDSIVSGDSIIKTYELNIDMGISAKKQNLPTEEKSMNISIGEKLPSQPLSTINGNLINLNELAGKPTLLNFWFTTCKPCIDEMPLLNKIKEKYLGRVNFIAITFEDKEKVLPFLKEHPFEFKKIIDAKEYIDQLGVTAYPKNIFIDKNGIVRRIENGIPYILQSGKLKLGDGENFENYIENLL